MSRKFDIDKSEDVDRLLKTLDEIDLDDEFLDDFEPEDEVESDSDATSIDSDEGEPGSQEEMFDQDQSEEQMDVEDAPQDPFTWTDNAQIDRREFPFTGNSGVNQNLVNNTSIDEIFESFIGGEIIDLIVHETNKYAANYIAEKRRQGKMRRKSRDLLCKEPTNPGEINR